MEKKIPDGCIEIPLEEVDYIYQPPQSHTPVIVMKQKLPPMQSRVLECMRCGSKKNLNTNKDKSFVECDECMWGNGKLEKQEEWKGGIQEALEKDFEKLYVKEYTTGWKEQRYLRNIEIGIMGFDNLERFISQLLSESKEKAKIEVLEKVLEKKTNYEMEREEHGYRVTLEYVLADDIKKEIKLLKEKE